MPPEAAHPARGFVRAAFAVIATSFLRLPPPELESTCRDDARYAHVGRAGRARCRGTSRQRPTSPLARLRESRPLGSQLHSCGRILEARVSRQAATKSRLLWASDRGGTALGQPPLRR